MLFYVPDLLKLKIQTKLKDFDIFTNFVPLENKCTELARPKNNLERKFFCKFQSLGIIFKIYCDR